MDMVGVEIGSAARIGALMEFDVGDKHLRITVDFNNGQTVLTQSSNLLQHLQR